MLVSFGVVNSIISLAYFALYKRDFNQTAATLASIVVLGRLIELLIEYLLPYIRFESSKTLPTERNEELAAIQAAQKLLAKAKVGARLREDEAAGRPPPLKIINQKDKDNDDVVSDTSSVADETAALKNEMRLRMQILSHPRYDRREGISSSPTGEEKKEGRKKKKKEEEDEGKRREKGRQEKAGTPNTSNKTPLIKPL